jgi:hypothetical protein
VAVGVGAGVVDEEQERTNPTPRARRAGLPPDEVALLEVDEPFEARLQRRPVRGEVGSQSR